MLKLSVTRDPEGESGLNNIDVDSILMLDFAMSSDKVAVHTAEEIYFTVGTLKYWNKTLNNSGYRFGIADRSNCVNLEKIEVLDKTLKIAYFEKDFTSKSKRCMIARYRFKEVAESLMLVNPNIIITASESLY
ncbi:MULTISPECIES: LytTR family transcriptional regulator DNA-binding domain-containing protein [Paenibacillus]|uniref:HTH LytTR-type domain-containing protein n=1 Tax=Paenibacillus odorifer TaxID=189426 RepID=A0AB36J3N1_9BACL|nr:LytTR family transcriptional regulator DNA-binding domain-containing protein [Paenibacillus odorifer]OMD21680.1 hypothetical protein BJP48_29755 [Paenibacillus odorifer]OME08058.1 hypothetical protein BSK60_30700 [Paenibacillus odorifer]OME11224.1 hypothetical protein BSK47_29470 [Paenibacillus odorifer]